MESHESDRLCTYREVCDRLRLSEPTVRNLIRAGVLDAQYAGRAVRILDSSVTAYIHGRTQASDDTLPSAA